MSNGWMKRCLAGWLLNGLLLMGWMLLALLCGRIAESLQLNGFALDVAVFVVVPAILAVYTIVGVAVINLIMAAIDEADPAYLFDEDAFQCVFDENTHSPTAPAESQSDQAEEA